MALKLLDTEQQISIQAVIRSWDGKLTWDLLVTKIESSLSITTTRQTLDKYLNIKNEYKEKKRLLKGKPISTSDTELISYLEKDIDLAEKVIQLEAEVKVARDEIGYLQAFIQKIANISESNPAVMDVFNRTLQDIESKAR
jgi:dGTP triphosphohydrolase